MKDQAGWVHLKGCVKDGAGTIFTLPASYRPSADALFPVVAHNAFGAVVVRVGGGVEFAAGTNQSVYLDGITFKAA